MTTTTGSIALQLEKPSHRDDMTELTRALWPLSKRAVLKLGMILPLAMHRSKATPEQMAVAHLATAAHEDCGACLRIAKRQALAAGLSRGRIEDVVAGHRDALPPDLQLVDRLARDVLQNAPEATATSREVADRLGEKALADLALGIAIARFFPTAKRAMGLAVSCSLGGTDV